MTEQTQTQKQPQKPKSRTRRVDRWRIELLNNNSAYFFIDDVEGCGMSQYAILYPNNEVGYDYPERFTLRQRFLLQKAMKSLKKA